ncbi:MAG TPA: tyrosine-type recombinase/integrase [Bryobacteraceae bacterium]
MALILKPINEAAGRTEKPVYTFGGYLEDIFLPLCRRKWKESTRMTTEPRMVFHLKPVFGTHVLRAITREQLQSLLDQKAQTLSRSIVDHLRWDLNNVLKTAMSDGLIESNPAAALFTPPCKAEAEKLIMSPHQIRLALNVLDARERLIFRMAVFDGMRPGEILAISLGNVREDSVLVNQRVYKGDIDTPKGRRGKRTARTVALSPGTLAELAAWRTLLLDDSPEAFLFPSERGTPLSRDNVWNRSMFPRLEKVGLGWATFQVLRRTNATLSRKAKVDDKVAADQRGHGLGVSLEVYSLSDLEQKIEAVNRLEAEVIQ